jgi:anhydro-N-acetylmuramic acid kinase
MPELYIGLMSGTSLDGVDGVLADFSAATPLVVSHASAPFPAALRAELLALNTSGSDELHRAALAGNALMRVYAQVVAKLIAESKVISGDVVAIGAHGQTVRHQPQQFDGTGYTIQLCQPALLAELTGIDVACDFRSRDVAAGGQGAPLVPMADVLLFAAAGAPRVLLNLGGMANLTYVPRRAQEDGVLAFDTGPGVAVMDGVARQVDRRRSYDRDGLIAARGVANEHVLAELLADPFFAAPPPKSTGRERYGDAYAAELHARVPGADGVATAVELTARSVSDAVARWTPRGTEVVASGGGVHHPGLMAALERQLAAAGGYRLRRFGDLFFPGDAKEAVAFALLGYLTLHGQPGNVPAATGASGARVLGTITPA